MKITLVGALAIGGIVFLVVLLVYFLRKRDGTGPEQSVSG
jgi:preprotein translocase subunit Sss1